MPRWVQDGACLGIGAVEGMADQIGAEQDAKNRAAYVAANPGKKHNLLKEFGTYVNYLLPALQLVLVGTAVVKEEVAGALSATAGELAARKTTELATNKHYKLIYSPPPAAWTMDAARDTAAREAARRAAMFEVQDLNKILV